MATIAVIDYGMGNLRSVSKALAQAGSGARVEVTAEPGRIRRADRVVLPGVGAIRDCMAELARLGLVEVIRETAASKPFLGICLGMQALLEESEENSGTAGLAILPGRVRHFRRMLGEASSLKVPHMGWSRVRQAREHALWRGIEDGSRFYFVHSYYAQLADPALVTGRTDYGADFASAIGRENVFAVQFHPEKSQRAGLDLLANFARWDGAA